MPKPVKKAAKKRPSSDPNTRARQLQAEHMAKFEASEKPWQAEAAVPPVVPFAEQLSAHMRALGAKGGRIGGKRRLETLTQERRGEIALNAARARWAKRRPKGSD